MFERTLVREFAGRGEARQADARPECSERKDCPALACILITGLRIVRLLHFSGFSPLFSGIILIRVFPDIADLKGQGMHFL
ncbi:MAG: hypothetical protein K9J85_01610 [Desulfobacteraceae bacterium]|nr:hypothetical protein [Desulfobacteraceae bacterium]